MKHVALKDQAKVFSAFIQAFGKKLSSRIPQPKELGPGITRIWAHGIRLFFEPDIPLEVEGFYAYAVMHDPEASLTPDRREDYDLMIKSGRITLTEDALVAAANRFLLPGTGLERASAKLDEDGIRLTAHVKFAVILPVTIEGDITLENGKLLLKSRHIAVANIGLGGLMRFMHLDLASVFQASTAAVKAQGNTLILDPEYIVPAPRILGRLQAVRLGPGTLTLDYGSEAARPALPIPADRYLFLKDHTLKLEPVTLHPVEVEVLPFEKEAPFEFSLTEYREQLEDAKARLLRGGQVILNVPPLKLSKA